MLRLDSTVLNDLDTATSREWLETNGIGGYAFGTVSGVLSRRYHGLLVAASKPPLGRVVLLSKFEEALVIGEDRYDLSTNRYANAIDPHGFQFLSSFSAHPFPTWTFEVAGLRIERSLFMVHGENSVVCRWSVVENHDSGMPARLELRPLIAFRDHHHLSREDRAFETGFTSQKGHVRLRPRPDMPQLYLSHNAAEVSATGYWYRDYDLAVEQERGFDHIEDLYQPLMLAFDLESPAEVIASTELRHIATAESARKAEVDRRQTVLQAADMQDPLARQLNLAADQFVVDRGAGKTVIAGYPWFSDWGRDTMIALPGLTLSTGRPEIAKSILLEFSRHISQGMLPNRFPDVGAEPEYNTVDATLWYFEAIRSYAEQTGDYDTIRLELFEKLCDIIEWHVLGTRYGIHVDTDGLLCAGAPGVQLTWMDAKIGDHVVTPRTGKPVEIQALWYNALRIMAALAKQLDHEELHGQYSGMADLARASFLGQFWFEDGGYLYDVVDGRSKDGSLRPNQLLAISLPYPLVDGDKAARIVNMVEQRLLTPVGLRSLEPSDPRYVGTYIGSPEKRDSSYHQGTVWGWLIGPFVDAYRAVHAGEDDLDERVREMLDGFREHLSAACMGQVSEIFDGDPPHTPRGCPAQAWSVAELLRVLTTKETAQ